VSALVVYAGSGLSTIDAKARVTIPAELRDAVAQSTGENSVCLQRHPTLPCLIGYGRAEKEQRKVDLNTQWSAAINRGSAFDREAEGAGASSIFETNFESSGRFVIPSMLKSLGKLSSDRAFFFGVTTHFMLWNPDIFLSSAPPAFAHVRDELDYWLSEASRRGK
jgi:MraZ protein